MGWRDRIALGVGLAVIVLGYVGLEACQPAASTIKGEVVSVAEHGGGHVEVCLSDDCRDGQLEGRPPEVGECVTLRAHHSALQVEAATGC